MFEYSLWFIALLAVALIVILWPLIFRQKNADSDAEQGIAEQLAFNEALYRERVKDIEAQRKTGELDNDQADRLVNEATKQLEQDNDISSVTKRYTPSRPYVGIVVMAICVPLLAAGLYWYYGAAPDWEIHQLLQQKALLDSQQSTTAQRTEPSQLAFELYEKLSARADARPDNLNNWIVLARNAYEVGELSRSIEAYQAILNEKPDSPQVLTELAQVVFLGSGRKFSREVKILFDRAIELDPTNTQIPGLAGFDAFQAGDFQNAISYWQAVLKMLPPNDPSYATWQQSIARAKSELAKTGVEVASNEAVVGEGEGSSAPSVAVKVSLASDALGSLDPNTTVFVYARAWRGAKMPLAMARLQVKDLPTEVELTEAMAMAPQMTIKQFEELEVVARVSLQGSAQAQSGDWQATVGPVKTAPNQKVELIINQQIP
ncbi:c-type cytochrome biogenesis protein CcmI [Aurantivibrio plasticivorans]